MRVCDVCAEFRWPAKLWTFRRNWHKCTKRSMWTHGRGIQFSRSTKATHQHTTIGAAFKMYTHEKTLIYYCVINVAGQAHVRFGRNENRINSVCVSCVYQTKASDVWRCCGSPARLLARWSACLHRPRCVVVWTTIAAPSNCNAPKITCREYFFLRISLPASDLVSSHRVVWRFSAVQNVVCKCMQRVVCCNTSINVILMLSS